MAKCIVIFLVAVSFLPTLALAGPNFKPGNWEITTKTEIQGMPQAQVPSQTHTQCMKKGDFVPHSKEASKACKISGIKESGNSVSWKIVCSGKNGNMEGSGTVSYKGDTMKGSMELEIKNAGMKIRNFVTGRRLGDCPTKKSK